MLSEKAGYKLHAQSYEKTHMDIKNESKNTRLLAAVVAVW